jgi:hypothetical protein
MPRRPPRLYPTIPPARARTRPPLRLYDPRGTTAVPCRIDTFGCYARACINRNRHLLNVSI